jgi:hypothetical protein
MVTRAAWRAYIEYEYDDLTGETVASGAPYQFQEEFVGAGHSSIPAAGSPATGYPWVKKIVGAAPPTVALVANASEGQVACTLTSASQAQEASLYWNDNLSVDTTKYGQWEARAALSVAPSATGVQAAIGLGSAWVGGPQNLAEYLMFGWSASGALLIWALDGVNSAISVAAAQIGGAAITSDTNMHIFRIDYNDKTNIGFYYDGNRVNAVGSVPWAATGASAILQPWSTVYKPSGAGVATLTVDKIDIFSSR